MIPTGDMSVTAPSMPPAPDLRDEEIQVAVPPAFEDPAHGESVELVIQPRQGWIGIDWAELFRYRELLYFLVWRDVKVRYKQAVLGIAWAVLQPVHADDRVHADLRRGRPVQRTTCRTALRRSSSSPG